MQYVAIEWPNAVVRELDTSTMALADIESMSLGCDLALVGFSAGDADELDWVQRMGEQAGAARVVAVIDGEPALAQMLLRHGVYCHDRNTMSTAQMRAALRAAMRERISGLDDLDKTAIMDAAASRSGQATHPVQAPPLRRVEVRGYRLIRKLGKGGMSEVYLAQSTHASRVCALKILPTERTSAPVLDLFIEECTIVSGLNSPYVVRIYDHGVTDDYVYVAMEYIENGDLRERISLGIEPDEARRIFLQLARALDVIHRAGIVHGDIKPQNVMFRDRHSLVLVDFGVSRLIETSTVLRAGQVIGTPAYISPEHVLGQPMDGRSDLYSAGVLLFEMLTGEKPYTGDSVDRLLRMHAESPVPRLPAGLDAFQPVIDRLMAKLPSERFFSAKDLIEHLQSPVTDGQRR
jgi:serine/threonine protein kinase